jgi:hypothetical protein
MKLMSHLDACIESLVWGLKLSGILRLAALGGSLKFVAGLFDPNVSYWTTKTPKTTANL